MAAVANPTTFSQMSRPWPGGTQGLNTMNGDVRAMLAQRKKTVLPRSNSSSSISSVSSTSSAATTVSSSHSASVGSTPPLFGGSEMQGWSAPAPPKGRPPPSSQQPSQQQQQQQRGSWGPSKDDYSRPNGPRNGTPIIGQGPLLQNGPTSLQQQQQTQSMVRPGADMNAAPPQGQPVLYLLSMNGSFDRKTITVPFAPECVKIGRQTNAKTAPTAVNGYFDSKVLSRQHAEIHADRQTGKVYIRDIKSSNGTFVNGLRLSPENRESDPHELTTGDHLELGIDIINEDQKSIIHHKVSAKVEHAGWPAPSNSVFDMSFGDLDPANGSMMMMPNAVQAQYRGRGGAPSNGNGGGGNGGMMQGGRAMGGPPAASMVQPGPGSQRQLMMASVTTDLIVKRLNAELRGARLQQQDLGRAAQLVSALTKEKSDKPDSAEPSSSPVPNGNIPNGVPNGNAPNGTSNNTNAKARFSEPPAPPPSQPLPEKPDVPSLKRASTERPKLPSTSDSTQITLLTDALNNAKMQFDSQSARVQELEMMLVKERAARELAEAMAKKLEESALSAIQPDSTSEDAPQPAEDAPPSIVATLQSRIETMSSEFCTIKAELEAWRKRTELAEAARDSATQSLAQMVLQVKRDDEARQAAEERKSRSRSRRRSRKRDALSKDSATPELSEKTPATVSEPNLAPSEKADDCTTQPSLSRTSTVTPSAPLSSSPTKLGHGQNPTLLATIPYVAMVGVVAVGMSLMAYLNRDWQPSPTSLE